MLRLAKYLTLMIALMTIGILYFGIQIMAVHKQNQTLKETNAQLQFQVTEKEESTAGLADQVNQLNEELAREVEQRKTAETKVLELSAAKADRLKTMEASLRKSVPAAADASSGWMDFKASFYNTTGTTRSGKHTEDGVTIAVDPNIIPLGSWVEVKFPDGHVETRRADDTGGAIHGNKVDVYMARSTRTLMDLGVQNIQLRTVQAKVL